MKRVALGVIISALWITPGLSQGPQINGDWNCTVGCACEGAFRSPAVVQSGKQLTLTNQCGLNGRGEITGDNTFTAQFGPTGLTGNIEDGGNRLRFSNGTVWERSK
jgi:hypothetical protein